MGFHKSSERGAAEDNQFLVEVLDYSSPPELLGRRGEEDDYVTLHPSITNQLWVPDIFVDQAVRDAVYKICSFFAVMKTQFWECFKTIVCPISP